MGYEFDFMSFKEDMERQLRTVRARDHELSRYEMVKYRIRGIFNTIGEVEVMGMDYINRFARDVHRPELGEIAVIETAVRQFSGGKRNPMKVLSVIVFADVFSWNLFALKYSKWYIDRPAMGGTHGLEHLLN